MPGTAVRFSTGRTQSAWVRGQRLNRASRSNRALGSYVCDTALELSPERREDRAQVSAIDRILAEMSGLLPIDFAIWTHLVRRPDGIGTDITRSLGLH